MAEGASGWNIGLWTGENKVQRDYDDGGGEQESKKEDEEKEGEETQEGGMSYRSNYLLNQADLFL